MKLFTVCAALCFLGACQTKKTADLLIHHATIYSVDSNFTQFESMVVKDGKILALGSNDEIQGTYSATETIDAGGKPLYPGFIDAHSHFLAYGLGLQKADLAGSESWTAILETLKAFAPLHPDGWLIGRGWDQNDWNEKSFPTNAELNKLFPDRPVYLSRIDGHAAIANQKALDIAGIRPGQTLLGGEIETKKGQLTGLLIDNATDLVFSKIPRPGPGQIRTALLNAQEQCFSEGLTTVDECGLDYPEVQIIDSLQKAGDLRMRIYVMLSDAPQNYDYIFRTGKIKTPYLNVSAFKVYADGALGSRGACLLNPYEDQPGHYGFFLNRAEHFDSVAALLYKKDFQMCTHAIGDSGNRMLLNTYGKYLKGKNDRRWRIEHAQVVHPDDLAKFANYAVIPSVQPTHATSDMYWAESRLGKERVKTAYSYRRLLQQNGWLPLGTDFPVEAISPFKTFYAATVRKDAKGFPKNGFQVENALTREDALRGMTIWAARSNFEEQEKGSLEPGKMADFIILDKDLLKIPDSLVLTTQVIHSFLSGKQVFTRRVAPDG